MTLNGAIVRSERNPILTPADFSPDVNAVFNPGACAHDGGTLLLVRVEDRTGISRLVVATSPDGMGGWTVEETRGLTPEPDRFEERLGGRGPTHHADRRDLLRRLHRLLGRRSAGLPRDDRGLRHVRAARGHHPAGGQGRGAVPGDLRRPVGPVAPSRHGDGGTRRARVAVVEPGPSVLGRRSDPPARAAGRVVGREQGRDGAPSAAHRRGMVALLPRRARNGVGLALPGGARAPRPRRPVRGPAAHRRVGLRSHRVLRAHGRRPRRGIPTGWVLGEDGDTLRMYYGAADSVVGVATASLAVLLAGLRQGRDA